MKNSFSSELTRYRRSRVSGLLVAGLLIALASLVLLFWLLGMGDLFFAWSQGVRVALAIAMIALALAGLVWVWIFSRREDSAELARLADGLTGSHRQEIAAVQSLPRESTGGELASFLEKRLREEATAKLQALDWKQRWPLKGVKVGFLALAAVVVVLAVSFFANQDAARTVAARLFFPTEDHMPWSPLKFEVTPDNPEVFYGGDLVMRVGITGGEIKEEVRCLVRRPSGKVSEFGVYADGGTGRFARSLEQVVEPLEVAFSVGKARSQWQAVEPLLRPQITGARVTVTPPAYTGLPEREFTMEGRELKVLAGSKVKLQVDSNRPLAGGELTLSTFKAEGEARGEVLATTRGETVAAQTSEFVWQANRSGQVQAYLQDVRGTNSAEALELNLRVQEDAAPNLDLESPPPLLLATPSSALSLQGVVEDDFGLAKVELVRALAGFPERRETVADLSGGKDYAFDEALNLDEVGVEPGQILEFYAEATDRNPSLLGLGTSTVAKVQIISEEDYAKRIREQTTLREFAERYNRLSDAVSQSREALDELEKAGEEGQAEDFEEARKRFIQETRKAQEELKRLEEDFPAFELEKQLGDVAKKLGEALQQNQAEAKELTPEQAKEAIARMRERLGAAAQEAEELEDESELVKAFGTIAEMAAKFRAVQERQESLEHRVLTIVKEVNKGILRNTAQLEGLAEMQDRNRKELEELAAELKKRNEALPDELTELRLQVVDFLTRYQILEIPSAMTGAREAGLRGESSETWRQAQLARQLIDQLLGVPNAFSSMVEGNGQPGFGQCSGSAAATMQQLLDALMAQRQGEGQSGSGGAGGGMGGTGSDGFAAPGVSMADIPVIGPSRMSFQPEAMAGRGGEGRSGKQKGPQQASEQETLTSDEQEEGRFGELSELPIPEKYRQAVQRYFSNPPQTKDNDES